MPSLEADSKYLRGKYPTLEPVPHLNPDLVVFNFWSTSLGSRPKSRIHMSPGLTPQLDRTVHYRPSCRHHLRFGPFLNVSRSPRRNQGISVGLAHVRHHLFPYHFCVWSGSGGFQVCPDFSALFWHQPQVFRWRRPRVLGLRWLAREALLAHCAAPLQRRFWLFAPLLALCLCTPFSRLSSAIFLLLLALRLQTCVHWT